MNTNTEKNTIEDQNEEEAVGLTGVESKFAVAKKMVRRMREELDLLEDILSGDAEEADVNAALSRRAAGEEFDDGRGGRIVEGVFDGQNMIGSDGQRYPVPPNYASKSKLVEGDILKLTVRPNGAFLFKQIGPIERDRRVGTLTRDEMSQDWRVIADGKKYNVLAASVSFFRGEEGDEAAVLIPRGAPSKWAAIENVIKK